MYIYIDTYIYVYIYILTRTIALKFPINLHVFEFHYRENKAAYLVAQYSELFRRKIKNKHISRSSLSFVDTEMTRIIKILPSEPLRWRHNGCDSVSNHLSIAYSTVYSDADQRKLRVTGLCVGESPGTGGFPAQMASNAENVSIWWRHHAERTHYSIVNNKTADEGFVQQIYSTSS